jgi:hypothetical protein
LPRAPSGFRPGRALSTERKRRQSGPAGGPAACPVVNEVSGSVSYAHDAGCVTCVTCVTAKTGRNAQNAPKTFASRGVCHLCQ